GIRGRTVTGVQTCALPIFVCRELWVTLTACVLGTRRIKLGPGVTVPHSRHPSVTASAILTLDELAPGRIVLGMGTGGSSAQTMGDRKSTRLNSSHRTISYA